MEQYFNILFSFTHGTTMLIYTLLLILSTILARFAQPSEYYGTLEINKVFYVMAFMFLCVGLALADNGTDTKWYMEFFNSRESFNNCDYGAVELGYQYYNVLIHYITDNPIVFVVISRIMMIICVFWSIYILRDKTILWLAILGFAAVIYFQMFSALRNGLAYSLGFLVYSFSVKKKYLLALIFSIIGISFHRSMIIFVIPIVLYFLVIKLAPKLFVRIAVPLLLLTILVIYLYGVSIIEYFLTSDDVLMGKYDSYLHGEGTQGYMIYFVYFPLACVFFDYKYLKELDENYFYLNVFLSIIGFSFALLAYQVGQLTRLQPFFTFPFLFYIGFYLLNSLYDEYFSYQKINLFMFFFTLYWGYRFTLFISSLFYSNGLDKYSLYSIDNFVQ